MNTVNYILYHVYMAVNIETRHTQYEEQKLSGKDIHF